MKKVIFSSIVLAAVFTGCGGDGSCCDAGAVNNIEKKSVGVAPVATITNLTDGTTITAGQNLSVDGSTSADRDGTVTGYTWKVDGVSVSTEVNPTISITTLGTHEVCLTVVDNDNLNSINEECRTVTVTGLTTLSTPVAPTAVIDLSDSNGPLLAKSQHTFSCANSHDNDTVGTGAEIVACQWDIQSYKIVNGQEVPYRSCSDDVMAGKHIFICPSATRIVAKLTVTDNDGQTHSTTKEYTEFR